jgi:hydrogenase maturation protease
VSGPVLVACVGNILHRDDGFGVAVASRLAAEGSLPAGVELIETGIGGLSIVQQLMEGYEALIVVDAVDRGAAPGTVFVLEPQVSDPATLPLDDLLARALGVLPERVLLVGCQPRDCEGLGEDLSPPVRAAVTIAAERVRELAEELVAVGSQPSDRTLDGRGLMAGR